MQKTTTWSLLFSLEMEWSQTKKDALSDRCKYECVSIFFIFFKQVAGNSQSRISKRRREKIKKTAKKKKNL